MITSGRQINVFPVRTTVKQRLSFICCRYFHEPKRPSGINKVLLSYLSEEEMDRVCLRDFIFSRSLWKLTSIIPLMILYLAWNILIFVFYWVRLCWTLSDSWTQVFLLPLINLFQTQMCEEKVWHVKIHRELSVSPALIDRSNWTAWTWRETDSTVST